MHDPSPADLGLREFSTRPLLTATAGPFTPFRACLLACLLASLGSVGCGKSAPTPTVKPIPAIGHVLVISIDGMRPDVMLRAPTPSLHYLMSRGCFTFYAATTDIAKTLPSHTSMLTGASPERHGVTWNDFNGTYPRVPTLFDRATQAGLTTAMVASKPKFKTFERPGALTWCEIVEDKKGGDQEVAQHAVKIINEHKPQVMFVHFREVDDVGHGRGWGTVEQLAAMARVDDAVGTVMDALDEAGLTNSTAVIVSSDHGGTGKNHGGVDARSRYIPWIAAGPGIRGNYDLTSLPLLQIRTTDTFATACWLMGIRYDSDLDCKPVQEILAPAEMIRTKAE